MRSRIGWIAAVAAIAALSGSTAAADLYAVRTPDISAMRVVPERKVAEWASTRALLSWYRGGIFRLANPRVRISRVEERELASLGADVVVGTFDAGELEKRLAEVEARLTEARR